MQSKTIHRLRIQGFEEEPEQALVSLNLPLRFASFVSLCLIVVGAMLQSPWLLFAVSAMQWLAVFCGRHPVDLLFNVIVGLRKMRYKIPLYPIYRRMAFALAGGFVGVSGTALLENAYLVSVVFLVLVSVVLLLNVFFGVCLSSMFFRAYEDYFLA